MSSKIEYSQVIALSPNRLQTFSATPPSPTKPVYFAFGCESLINIVNRTDFSRTTIQTPETTSPIISLTFSGSSQLFCLNKKGILYAYSLNSLQTGPIGSLDIHCTPVSLVSSNKYIFYIDDETLYQINIDDLNSKTKDPKMLTDKKGEKFTELSISPCGRSLVAFTIGEKMPEIWFHPFREKQHSNLPIRSNLIDFKWGLSETLMCVTATDDGIIRIWEEQNDSLNLHQKSWFHFDQQILFACFCLPINDRHQPQHYHPAQSSNSNVFPLSKTFPYNIIVGLKNGLIYVFKENNQPQLSEITHFLLNSCKNKNGVDKNTRNKNNCINSNCINDNSFNGDLIDDDFTDSSFRYYAIADFRDDFIENQFKKLITLTLFSKKSLSFHYIEIGDSSVLTTVPYRISFICSNIKSIETNEFNHVLTQMEDDKLVNWSLVQVETIKKTDFDFVYNIKNGKVKKNIGISIKSNAINVSQIENEENNQSKISKIAFYQLDFEPLFSNFVDKNGLVIGFLSSKEKAVVVFITEKSDENKFIINAYKVDHPPDFQINKVAFHSSDLFAVASDQDIQTFIYQDGQFNFVSSLNIENNSILFLPKLIFAVASKKYITFFSLTSKDFVKIMSVQSTHITAMNYINKSLIVGTKHVLFRLFLSKEMFPLPIPLNDQSIFNTALSICHFSVIQDFINGEKPTLNSFLKRTEVECFSLKPTTTKNKENNESENKFENKESENENKNQENNEDKNKELNDKDKIELPYYFDKFWKSLPTNWPNVDNCGMKFIFSMTLIHLHNEKIYTLITSFIQSIEKRGLLQLKSLIQIQPEELLKKIQNSIQSCISFFSIWGLLSSDQSNLAKILSFKSITEICMSYLPLWMKNDIILKKTIDKFILDNIPQPDTPNYDFDAFILLCVIFDKKTFASKIAKKSYNNSKIASFLENYESTPPEKIEKSAYAAYSQHRFSLSAMFFYLRGMKDQAISVLGNDTQNPLLSILVARLIKYENWKSLIKNEEFYYNWWNNESDKEKALTAISNFDFNSIRIHKYFIGDKELADENKEVIREYDTIIAQISLMVAAHKYEMLNKLKFNNYRKYLLDIQKIPYLIVMYISNETSSSLKINSLTNETNENDASNLNPHDMFPNILKLADKSKEKEKEQNQKLKDEKVTKPSDDFSFSFGAGLDFVDDNIDSDDFSSDDSTNEEEEEKATDNEIIINKNENENKEIEFKSNITEMFLADSFESTYAEPLLLSEEYVITLLSELYNRNFTKQTIMFLLSVAKDLLALPQSLHIISMIMFSITFSLSDFTWMAPIIQFNFDPLYIITVLDHYTELMNSEDDSFNKSFYNEINEKEKSPKIKKSKNISKTSSHLVIKSNSMNSFNIASSISSPLNRKNSKKNIHFNDLNMDKSDELYNIISTDNDSSTSNYNSSTSSDEEQEINKQNKSNNNTNNDNLPNFFKVICPNIVPTKSDKELACFIAFDRMLTVLNELLTNSNPTIFTSFLHHRHRLMYRKIKSFRFSQQEIARDLDAAGLKCQVIERMRHTRENRIWAISLADKFTSPFFSATKNSNSLANLNMPNYSFQYTSSYNLRTTNSRVYDVCIDPIDNQQIALATKQVVLMNTVNPMMRDSSYSIAEHELKRNEIDGLILDSINKNKDDEFKSPLLSFLTQQKIAKWEIITQDVLTRKYNNKWPKANGQNAKNIKATCLCSHPSKRAFVSGDTNGHLHYWNFIEQTNTINFNSPSLSASNCAKFFHGDYKIRSVRFNKAGDRICSIDSNGRIAVSDFVGFQSFNVETQYTSVEWLNNDNQFVVCCNENCIDLNDINNKAVTTSVSNSDFQKAHQNGFPKLSPSVDNLNLMNAKLNTLKNMVDFSYSPYQNKNISASTTFSAGKKSTSLQIFDILTGTKPVAVFDMNKPLPHKKVRIPLDVFGPLVISGYNDGSAAIFDVRCGMRLANLPLHSQAVTAVKFDDSGSFFVTGGMDNKVVVGEAISFVEFDQLDDVLPNYDPKSKKRGIFNLAVSKQTIVACGYSSHIHVWNKTEPSPM